MANYYIQGSNGFPFGLDALNVSGRLFPKPTDPNILIGYFGLPDTTVNTKYNFRIWEGLNTNLNIWYGKGSNHINNNNFAIYGNAILRSQFGLFDVTFAPVFRPTLRISFNQNTKEYSYFGTTIFSSVNFISNNSSIIGSSASSQNSASYNLYYDGWVWEKDFTFDTTSTVNYKIFVGGGRGVFGDNNQDGIAALNENFIPLNVIAGNTYRFRVKGFTHNNVLGWWQKLDVFNTFEYEVIPLTSLPQKQNQFISTPLNIYNKVKTSPPFSLQATTNSNLPLFYSTSSPLFTLDTNGVVNLLGSSGSGIVSIFQPGDEQWFPASKNVTVNIEEASGSCISQCLDTGLLYFTDDTFIKLYNQNGSGLFSKNYNETSRSLVLSNESWQNYYTGFTGYQLSGFNNTSAGIILNINDSTKNNNQNKFSINYGVNESRNIVGNYHKQLIRIRPQKPKNIGYLGYLSNDRAWATYDVSTGMITGSLAPNNVFSYGIDIVGSGVLSGNNFYYTGDIDVTTETGKAYVLNLEKNPVLYTENFSVLNVISFNEIKDFCKDIEKCEETKEPEPLEVCYTGDLSNTLQFQNFLSGYAKIANTVIINRPEGGGLLISSGDGETIKYANTVYSGYILYNNWQSGDYIKWNLYGFNYVDLYQSFHLGNYPPYLNTGFTLYYPNDFNSLDSLVNALNDKVDLLKNYPVWYPYECLKDTESGIFLTGELMKFSKNTGSTGSLPISHFNNRVDFISLRSYPQLEDQDYLSYGISIFSPKRPQRQLFSGWSYLIPTVIQLEGFNRNTQSWEILDVNGQGSQGGNSIQSISNTTNFFGELISGDSIKESIGNLPGIIQEEEEEKEESLPQEEEKEGPDDTNCKDVIFTDQQRNINFNANPLCPPKISFRDIIVTIPKEECKQKTVDANGNIVQKKSNAELCGNGGGGADGGGDGAGGGQDNGGGGDGTSVGNYYIYQTGWNLNMTNTSNQLSILNKDIQTQNFNINKIYDKYKVSLANFVSIPDPKLFQKNAFFIRRVKFYTLDKSGFGVHKGPSLCSINADYTVDVSGLFPIEISGTWNYNLLPEESGIYRFFKTPFAKRIEENEKLVKFNKVSGKIISPSGTGYLSTSGYGVGPISYQNSDYYFYNPDTQSVYFTEVLTGLATGSSILSGNKIIVKQSIINQEVLFGGRLANSPSQYHEIVSNGNFVSNIEDVEYVKYDVLGFYPITGRVTGNTVSGALNTNITKITTGIVVGGTFAYYPEATGFTYSEATISINYNTINNFDFISINENELTFNSNNISFLPPIFFNNNDVFINTINSDTGSFLVRASTGANNSIKLNSLVKGASGNINLVLNSTGIVIINYESGKDFYPRLYKIVTQRTKDCISEEPEFINLPGNCSFVFNNVIKDPIMTGNFSDLVYATGFYYSSNGSGYITGDVATFFGVRTFDNIWSLQTGFSFTNLLDFKENEFFNNSQLINNQFFEKEIPYIINTKIGYFNQLDAASFSNVDLADLIITDINNPETEIINFRITGII